MELSLKLKNKYKSFPNGFQYKFEGKLIILSGVNGSGKTQLLNIIHGTKDTPSNQNLDSEIFLNDKKIDTLDIDFRSFKENIHTPNLTTSTSQTFLNSVNAAWKAYNNNRLNPQSPPNSNYTDSCIYAKKLLVKKFSPQIFENQKIDEEEFKSFLRDKNFIWKPGDRFTNSIGEIFFNHAILVSEKMKEVSRSAFKETMLPKAPWKELNELFEELDFEYRFKDDYFIIGVEINEQPNLFKIKADGSLDTGDKRLVQDLSDGEKALISLCFASLSGRTTLPKKVLLLDEFDSVLNPSLTEKLFIVIEKYFIKKDVLVILSTHSPATISLSPDYTTYYEVFKINRANERILQVNKDEYSDLKLVNKEFYDRIRDQDNRIQQLQARIEDESDLLIITEGKTDWKYFIAALRYFHKINQFQQITEDCFYKYGSQEDVKGSVCGTRYVNSLSESQLNNYLDALAISRNLDKKNTTDIRIGLFDSDTSIKLKNEPDKGIYSFKIQPNGISTEFLFSEQEIKTKINGKRLFIGEEFNKKTKINSDDPNLTLGGDTTNLNKAGKKVIIDADVYDRSSVNNALTKDAFSKAVFNGEISIQKNSWENFRNVFNEISRVIETAKIDPTKREAKQKQL